MASTQAEEARRDALVERLFGATIGAFDMCAVYIGDRLGLYRALAQHGPASAGELGRAAGIHERYALEWLEHQAVSGILDVSEAEDGVRRFVLPVGHAEALLDEESLNYASPSDGCWSPVSDQSTHSSMRTGTEVASPTPPTAWTSMRARRHSRGRCSHGCWLGVVAVRTRDPRATPSRSAARVADVACGRWI